MGKGDKKTRRGKIVIGSYGVRRPRKSKNISTLMAKPGKKATKAPDIEGTNKEARKKSTAKPALKKTESERTVEDVLNTPVRAETKPKKSTSAKAKPKSEITREPEASETQDG